MVRTASTMLPLGTTAPNFSLPDVDGRVVSRDSVRGTAGLLVVFLCNHCPYVKHVAAQLAQLSRDALAKNVGVVGISSNDISTHPDDSPELMKQEAAKWGYPFPYLYDESQQVAQAYHAACTPDFYLFDSQLKLVYRGQMDQTRPNQGTTATGADLRAAIDALVAGSPIPEPQKPSIGCNIKWKAGAEPNYFQPAGNA
ncbi:MAG: thioredoxin family protein [Pirellulaceae bacterium]|nr:thioredoxin family protein [Pirellulaceae bacterium]